jgi:hypothetical protein
VTERITKRRREAEAGLIGIDAAPIIRQAAKEIWEQAQRQTPKQAPIYEPIVEVGYLVFEQPDGKWRAETLKEPAPGAGIVKVVEADERFLLAELKAKMCDVLIQYGVCMSSPEARKKVTSLSFRNMGKIALKDNGRSRV